MVIVWKTIHAESGRWSDDSLQSPNNQPFTAVSKQGHVDVAHNAPFPRKQGSMQQRELQSARPPGDE